MGRGTALLLSIGSLIAAPGCGGDDDGGPCDPAEETCVLGNTVSTLDVGPGVEDEDICQSWTLDNDTDLWVTKIKQLNGGAYHHANWFFVPDDEFDLPDGTWSCSENEFSELAAAVSGGYLFALSTQSTEEEQAIPAGGAIRIPRYSRLVGASHILNASDQTVATEMRVELTTVPADEVEASLVPARVSYHDLALTPNGRSSFSTDCMIGDAYEQVIGTPLDYKLYYALSHYHKLGVYAQLEIVGGERDGEVIFRNDGFGENFGTPIDPPLDLGAAGARGLRFTCGFENPRDEVVGWGIGENEMCVLALQASTDMAWDGDVRDGDSEEVATAEGEVQFAGPCSLLAFRWDHDKPGGPGPAE
jgi:hypothetical protein